MRRPGSVPTTRAGSHVLRAAGGARGTHPPVAQQVQLLFPDDDVAGANAGGDDPVDHGLDHVGLPDGAYRRVPAAEQARDLVIAPVAVVGPVGAVQRFELPQEPVVERRVVWLHALKNALIPVVTFAGIYFSILVTTAIVVETVFAWPGLGRLAYDGITSRDFPVIQAVVLTTAAIVAAVNLGVDLLYAFIDPRIRYAR